MGEETTTSWPWFLILPGDLLSGGGGVMLLLLLHSITCKSRDFLLGNILHSITVHDLLHWEICQRFAHHRPLSLYIPNGAKTKYNSSLQVVTFLARYGDKQVNTETE